LLDSNLTSPESGSLNRGRIAALLASVDMDGIRRLQNTLPPEQYARRIQAWKARYPNHPAASIDLNGTQVVGDGLQAIGIEQVALLLPLTGRFSAIGDAIKTGFIAARFADGSAVINLTAGNRIAVPTLSLNYIGEGLTGHANLFQFGLLPEDEARDAAQFAYSENFRKAVVFASDSSISQRLAQAFETAFTNAGGSVITAEAIAADSYDYSQQLTKTLDIDSSYARERRLERLLDTTIEFEPAIRSDIDVIFMAVDSEQALLLRPQLQFHRAGKLPLISTSQVYSGTPDPDRDGDLTGVIYNDIPWNLTDATINSNLYSTIALNHQDSIQKLVALGIDAYALHQQLDNMRLDPSISVNGKTGALTLAEGNRIRRRLQWAEFQDGIPIKISDALPVETTFPPLEGEL